MRFLFSFCLLIFISVGDCTLHYLGVHTIENIEAESPKEGEKEVDDKLKEYKFLESANSNFAAWMDTEAMSRNFHSKSAISQLYKELHSPPPDPAH